LPPASNNRGNFTTIKYIGNVPYITVTSTKKAVFNFPYSMGPGLYRVDLNLSAENNEITDTFNLTLINKPPYFVSNLPNKTIWDCTFLSYWLPRRIDPERNDVSLYFTYNASSYLSYNQLGSVLYLISPCNLTEPFYENVTLNISDGYYDIPYSFQIEVKNIPEYMRPSGVEKLLIK
jgi:hypothetical protein